MNRVVLITGVSSGIGRAAALAFAKAGWHVDGVARRRDRLDALAAQIAALPAPHGDSLLLAGDVTQPSRVTSVVDAAVERFGRVDVLVVNAGVGLRGTVADARWEDVETLLRLNIDGALHAMRAVVPVMRQQGSGHIMTVSSVVAPMATPYAALYAASKAFLSSVVRSMRVELEPQHILMTDFLVGRTATEFNEVRLGEGARRLSRIPAMPPERVAEALVAAAFTGRQTVVLRPFDRLLLWVNHWLPGIITRLAARQYR